ncbi:hypothetical protein [Kribbella sp. NPDC023855]|uniref:hypothetical protein n=1 Tax=Kribbella sp. NPDC023855 TaxID=3154698 RepID=UPI0033FA305D
MSASGQELAIVQSAATAVASIATTTSAIIGQIRATGLVRAEDRERLRLTLRALRHQEVSAHLARLGMVNMNHMFDLHDLADSKATSPVQYAEALRIAHQTTRALAANLDDLARNLR